jgi:hypothetical protein
MSLLNVRLNRASLGIRGGLILSRTWGLEGHLPPTALNVRATSLAEAALTAHGSNRWFDRKTVGDQLATVENL